MSGLKDQLMDLILCYNPIWLRFGLEVLYEEILPLSDHMVRVLYIVPTQSYNQQSTWPGSFWSDDDCIFC